MTHSIIRHGTGYATVLGEQRGQSALPVRHTTLSISRWPWLPEFVNVPTEARRYLLLAEQKTLQRALRRSVTIVHKATRPI